MDIDKDSYELVAGKIGTRTASLALWAVTYGLIAAGFVAIWELVYRIGSALQPLVGPLVSRVPSLPDGPTAPAVISFALSALIVAGMAVVFFRRVRASERRMSESFDRYLSPRLEGIFAKLTDIDNGNRERLEHTYARIRALEERGGVNVAAAALRGLQAVVEQGQLDPGQLTIHNARYGFGDRWENVTDRVRARIVNGRVDLPVTNDTMGVDPYRGQRKQLDVTYSVGGTLRPPVTVPEKKRLILPGHMITVPAGRVTVAGPV